MRLASISIDLDGLRHYEALHGLPAESRADAVVTCAPPRLADLLDERRAKGTFFAIGSEIPEGGAPLRSLAAAGHEIGNHTLDHLYALTRLTDAEIEAQVEGGAAAIARATGTRPVGFRAPGYTLSPELLAAVARTGHRYDSSTFPAAPYYTAKALVMGLRRVQRRSSAAILDRPGVLFAPRSPYRPSLRDPYKSAGVTVGSPLLELPITVDPWARIPFFGTLIVAAPWPLVKMVYASVRQLDFVNLELHGVDLMDPTDGMSEALVAKSQPDLRVPTHEKVRRLREVLGWLADDYELVPLAQAAERL